MTTDRRSWSRYATVVITVLTACGLMLMLTGSTRAAQQSVDIQNFSFAPPSLVASVGDNVTWTNLDPTAHTVTFNAGPVTPDSGRLESGATFFFALTQTGSYEYHCNIHPSMK